jgi:hypothetical protein
LLLHSFVNVVGIDRGYAIDRVPAVELALSGDLPHNITGSPPNMP